MIYNVSKMKTPDEYDSSALAVMRFRSTAKKLSRATRVKFCLQLVNFLEEDGST